MPGNLGDSPWVNDAIVRCCAEGQANGRQCGLTGLTASTSVRSESLGAITGPLPTESQLSHTVHEQLWDDSWQPGRQSTSQRHDCAVLC